MSDTTTPSTPPKKMWTRCNGCQERIYNDPHDMKVHAQHCPQDLLLALQKLRLTVTGDKKIPGTVEDSIVARLTSLEEVVGDLDEHISEPTLDPDGVDLDAYASVVGADEIEEPTSEAYEDAVAAFTTPPTTGTTQQVYDPVTGLYVAVQP